MLAINPIQGGFIWMDEKAIAQSSWIKEPGILSLGQKKYVVTVNSKTSDEIEITISKVTQSAYQRFKSFLSSLSENEKWRNLFDKREYSTTIPVNNDNSESIHSTFQNFRSHFEDRSSQDLLFGRLASASNDREALAEVKSCVEGRVNVISSKALASSTAQPVSNLRAQRRATSVIRPTTRNQPFLTETKVPIERVDSLQERYAELYNRVYQRTREGTVTETNRQELVKEIEYLEEHYSINPKNSDEISVIFNKLKKLESEVKAQLAMQKPKGILKNPSEVKVKPRRNVTFEENSKNDS